MIAVRLLSLILVLGVRLLHSETLSITLAQATLRQDSLTTPEKHWHVAIQFSIALSDVNASSPQARFELFDLTTGNAVVTLPAFGNSGAVQNPDLPQIFELTLAPDALDPTHSYALFAVGFLADGQPAEDVQSKLQFLRRPIAPSVPGPVLPQIPRPILQPDVATSKQDADIYINGEADFVTEAPGSRIASAIADIKLSVPYFVSWRQLQLFSPTFLLDASTVPGHNPNSMSFGLTWDSFTPLSWLIVRKDFLVESTTNFQISDGIFAPTLRLPLPARWMRPLSVVPFAGGEFGGNFNNPLGPANGAPIARGIFGADFTAYFHLEKTKVGLKGIGFEAQWLRRALAHQEAKLDEVAPGDYSLATFNRRPRDHAFAKLKFAVTDAFAFTVSYEDGQLPPSYQFVHDLVKIGLLYEAQIKARP